MSSSESSIRRVLVLGSTGSIGTQTLDVVAQHPDKLQVVGLSSFRNVDLLQEQAQKFGVGHLVLADKRMYGHPSCDTLGRFAKQHYGALAVGQEAVVRLVRESDADIVVNALVGAAGLQASLATLQCGKTLALANKESLVVGGDLIMPLVRSGSASLVPIDSEHGAIFQCLIGEDPDNVTNLWVTASGGPFRGWKESQLDSVTPEQALAHPTWHMGPKITIDSATLMNKGLEVIEAHHLFAMPYDRIQVVVQPQSAIHSMVEFRDGSVKAHLGTTDMRIPIQFALSYPQRWDAPVTPLDFRTLGSLEFESPDTQTFRCLALARAAGEVGGTLPCAMNAANEVAVAAFLDGAIGFTDIARCVEGVMDQHDSQPVESLEQLESIDAASRELASQWVTEHQR